MAKKNMIEREKKRERLINKYEKKRKEIKQLLKAAESYESKLALYEKLEKLPNNSKITESLTSILKEYNLSGKPTNKNRDKLIKKIVDHEVKLGLLL